jgi:hypothetical protein
MAVSAAHPRLINSSLCSGSATGNERLKSGIMQMPSSSLANNQGCVLCPDGALMALNGTPHNLFKKTYHLVSFCFSYGAKSYLIFLTNSILYTQRRKRHFHLINDYIIFHTTVERIAVIGLHQRIFNHKIPCPGIFCFVYLVCDDKSTPVVDGN